MVAHVLCNCICVQVAISCTVDKHSKMTEHAGQGKVTSYFVRLHEETHTLTYTEQSRKAHFSKSVTRCLILSVPLFFSKF